MSTRTASQKVLQSFHARDTLWEIFSEQAKEMECSIDYLINEAMRAYAEAHAFLPTGPGARTSQAPPPVSTPKERPEKEEESGYDKMALSQNRNNRARLSSLDMDDDDDLSALTEDDDDDDLSGLDLDERDSSLPPPPSETAPTLANPGGGIQPSRPDRASAAPPPPPPRATTSVPPVPTAGSHTSAPPPPRPGRAAPHDQTVRLI